MIAASWPLDAELAMYRRTGVDLIGLQAVKVRATGVDAVRESLAAHDVRLGYLVHAFTAPVDDDAAWDAQLAELTTAVTDARTLGADLVYFTTGPSGRRSWEEAADVLAARLAPVIERADALGVRLAIENTLPVRCDLSFTHTARDTFDLAERLGIGVCLDLYCCWQERGLAETVSARLPLIHLLQVSDFRVGTLSFPNRWVPGDADLPMARLLETVLDAGYTGIVDVELTGPAIEAEGAESALGRSLTWVRERLAGR